jgi:hypothetical protein
MRNREKITSPEKNEPLFDLIKGMNKAEKRNFKLYATRLEGNEQAKFILLFDHIDSAAEYNERKLLERCPITKSQLPNVKAHLYRQILISLRLLGSQHSEIIMLHEQLDFAKILYDKGLYRQSEKMLEKLWEQAVEYEAYSVALDVLDLQSKINMLGATPEMAVASDTANRNVNMLRGRIQTVGELSSMAVKAYALYQQLGYARTQKDLKLIKQYFKPTLESYEHRLESFREKFYFYQASAWYYYIQHLFVKSYRYSRMWVELFDSYPKMKSVMYEDYIMGCANILDGLYLMRKYKHFAERLRRFEHEFETIGRLNANAYILSSRMLFINRINKCFIEGEFEKGLAIVPEMEQFIKEYSKYLDVHFKMLACYKTACLYFGDGQYLRCMDYLSMIIETRDPAIRRDLQCFARILNLISSYEAGIDYNLDYQIRSVYKFIVKMNDMQEVQREMLSFLRKLSSINPSELRDELRTLYRRLQPYENHPYERRAFYYLDILSWLESKLTGRTMSAVLKAKL